MDLHLAFRGPQPRSSDQRRETRLATNTPVTVTVLGMLGEPKSEGTVLDMSGSGLRLNVPQPIPCGAPVKVEAGEMLMLGEVVRCEPSEDRYFVGVSVTHSLAALHELERLNGSLLKHEDAARQAETDFLRTRR